MGYPSAIHDRNTEIHELYERLDNHPGKLDESFEVKISDRVESLSVSSEIKRLILEGESPGNRSEAIMKVLIGLLRVGIDDQDIFELFESHPIGEKYHDKGISKESWLEGEIKRAREFIKGIPRDPHEEEIEKLNERHAVIMIGGKAAVTYRVKL